MRQAPGEIVERLKSGEGVCDESLAGGTIEGEVLPCADLRGADLSGAQFLSCDLTEALFTGATLSETVFEECGLTGAHFEEVTAHQAIFQRCTLDRATFRGADLFQAHFLGGILVDACLEACKAVNVEIDDASCSGATFRGADLSFSSALRSDLSGCDFAQANLTGASFAEVDLTGADLVDAVVDGFEVSGSQTLLDRRSFVRAIKDVMEFAGERVSHAFVSGASGVAFEMEGSSPPGEGDVFEEVDRIERALRVLDVPFRAAGAASFDDAWEALSLALTKDYLALVPLHVRPDEMDGAAFDEAAWTVLSGLRSGRATARTPFVSEVVLDRRETESRWALREGDHPFLFFLLARNGARVDSNVVGRALAQASRVGVERSVARFEQIERHLRGELDAVPKDHLSDLCRPSVASRRRDKETVLRFLSDLLDMTSGERRDQIAEATSCFRSAVAALVRLGELLPRVITPNEGEMHGRAFQILRDNRDEASALLRQIIKEEKAACAHLAAGAGKE